MTARPGGRDESMVDAAYARLGAAIARADENRALVTEAYQITSPQTALTLRCECMHRLCTEVVVLTLEEYEDITAVSPPGGGGPAHTEGVGGGGVCGTAAGSGGGGGVVGGGGGNGRR